MSHGAHGFVGTSPTKGGWMGLGLSKLIQIFHFLEKSGFLKKKISEAYLVHTKKHPKQDRWIYKRGIAEM